MPLDGHTLLISSMVARGCFALIFLFTWLRSREDGYLRDWGIGTGLISLGMLVVLASGPYEFYLAPPNGFLAYCLVGLGFAFDWIGIRRFDGRPIVRWVVAAMALTPGLVYVGLLQVTRAPNIAFSGVFAALCLSAVILAHGLFAAPARLRLPSRYVAGAAVLVYLASFVTSALLSLQEVDGVQDATPSDVVALFVDQLCGLFLNVALLALAGERARRDLEWLATRDPLTGLLNRRGLLLEASRHLAADDRDDPSVAVLVADLDGFKQVNDQRGHDAGDAVLVRFAALARAIVGRPGDLLSRYGGEEFVAVLPGATVEETLRLAEQLRLATHDEPFLTGETELRLTVSIGVAALAHGESSVLPAISRADAALYAAKQAGRNRVVA